jgi:folate-dependent phosphoribosylglycinamide formyltransferase PurN
MTRVAVLASGSGTNLQAILDHQSTLGASAVANVVLVASDHPDAGALARARDAGITALALDREARSSGLGGILVSHRVELLVLAGYLRLVPPDVVAHFRGRILNVHPALLPAFGGAGMYGHKVHEAVIARGLRLTGPTVHFVDERYDEGPIIAQWPCPYFPVTPPLTWPGVCLKWNTSFIHVWSRQSRQDASGWMPGTEWCSTGLSSCNTSVPWPMRPL